MEELYKQLGGLPAVISLVGVVVALWWRFKVPAIGVEMLERELEIHRHEVAEADKDRQALRQEIRMERSRVETLERDYMASLVARERALKRVRRCERLLKENDIDLPEREDD